MISQNFSECIESKSHLTITFDGDNEIDARLLIKSLTACAAILQETTALSDSDAYLNLKISPFRSGSFEIDLNALFTNVAPLIPHAFDFAKNVCETFVIYFQLKEVLKGKKPKEIIPNGNLVTIVGDDNANNNKITVTTNIYNFYQKPQINEPISEIFGFLAEDGTRQGMSIRSNDLQTKISSDLFAKLSTPETFEEQEDSIHENICETLLFIRKPDLMGNSKWGFYDGRRFDATIEDEEFLLKVKSGSLIFGSGDQIKVVLKTIFHLDENGFPILNKEKFIITKVLGVVKRESPEHPKQINL